MRRLTVCHKVKVIDPDTKVALRGYLHVDSDEQYRITGIRIQLGAKDAKVGSLLWNFTEELNKQLNTIIGGIIDENGSLSFLDQEELL